MDVRTWTTISRLLDDALDLPPAAREHGCAAWVRNTRRCARASRRCSTRRDSMDSAAFLATLPKFAVGGRRRRRGRRAAGRRGDRVRTACCTILASGGQGSVWLAERADGVLTRPVALKLPHGLAYRPGLAERMTRERDILAALTHPHIARLYDAGVTGAGEPYLALEYVDGLPIDRYAAEHGLTVAARVRLFLQVARAVAYAHRQLVIHRDLKPANILVTGAGEVRLLDFGIAKLLGTDGPGDSTLTVESGRALTLQYASPEQVRQEPLGVATDVYSLGVVLFELLTGVRPYDAAARVGRGRRASDPRRGAAAGQHPRDYARPAQDAGWRPRHDAGQGAQEGAGGALSVGRGAGRRPRALARRPAGAGAAGFARLPAAEVHRPPPRRGRGGGDCAGGRSWPAPASPCGRRRSPAPSATRRSASRSAPAPRASSCSRCCNRHRRRGRSLPPSCWIAVRRNSTAPRTWTRGCSPSCATRSPPTICASTRPIASWRCWPRAPTAPAGLGTSTWRRGRRVRRGVVDGLSRPAGRAAAGRRGRTAPGRRRPAVVLGRHRLPARSRPAARSRGAIRRGDCAVRSPLAGLAGADGDDVDATQPALVAALRSLQPGRADRATRCG